MLLLEVRHRAAAVKTAVEQALANVPSGGGQGGGQGATENTAGRPHRICVVTKPTVERSASDRVGRVGAFEIQVRPTAVRTDKYSVLLSFIVPRSKGMRHVCRYGLKEAM